MTKQFLTPLIAKMLGVSIDELGKFKKRDWLKVVKELRESKKEDSDHLTFSSKSSIMNNLPMYKLVKISNSSGACSVSESTDLEKLLHLAISKAEEGLHQIRDGEEILFSSDIVLLDKTIKNALDLAIEYHRGQVRKGDGKSPYIVHILQVSRLLQTNGFSNELIAAGICHDLLEDSDCSESLIEEKCGKEVLRIVKAVSNDETLEDKKDWERKKEKYIENVETGGEKAMIVCLCDKIANSQALLKEYRIQGAKIWERFNRGQEKKLWFERKVLEMLKRHLDHPLLAVYEDLIAEKAKMKSTKLKKGTLTLRNGEVLKVQFEPIDNSEWREGVKKGEKIIAEMKARGENPYV